MTSCSLNHSECHALRRAVGPTLIILARELQERLDQLQLPDRGCVTPAANFLKEVESLSALLAQDVNANSHQLYPLKDSPIMKSLRRLHKILRAISVDKPFTGPYENDRALSAAITAQAVLGFERIMSTTETWLLAEHDLLRRLKDCIPGGGFMPRASFRSFLHGRMQKYRFSKDNVSTMLQSEINFYSSGTQEASLESFLSNSLDRITALPNCPSLPAAIDACKQVIAGNMTQREAMAPTFITLWETLLPTEEQLKQLDAVQLEQIHAAVHVLQDALATLMWVRHPEDPWQVGFIVDRRLSIAAEVDNPSWCDLRGRYTALLERMVAPASDVIKSPVPESNQDFIGLCARMGDYMAIISHLMSTSERQHFDAFKTALANIQRRPMTFRPHHDRAELWRHWLNVAAYMPRIRTLIHDARVMLMVSTAHDDWGNRRRSPLTLTLRAMPASIFTAMLACLPSDQQSQWQRVRSEACDSWWGWLRQWWRCLLGYEEKTSQAFRCTVQTNILSYQQRESRLECNDNHLSVYQQTLGHLEVAHAACEKGFTRLNPQDVTPSVDSSAPSGESVLWSKPNNTPDRITNWPLLPRLSRCA